MNSRLRGFQRLFYLRSFAALPFQVTAIPLEG